MSGIINRVFNRTKTLSSVFLWFGVVMWFIIIIFGLKVLFQYENAPGISANPPLKWPQNTGLQRNPSMFTLVLLAHPKCPCTKASIGELDLIMASCKNKLTTYVLFFKPKDFPEEWVKTDLWEIASSIPGVIVKIDESGKEASYFHAVTSGQAVLYDPDGILQFSGGITGSRGHSGDNAGRSAVISVINQGVVKQKKTFVFGCSIFGSPDKHPGVLL